MALFSTLETARLILRPVVESDIDSWQKHFDDYEVIRNLSASVPWPYPKNGAAYFLKNVILPIQGNNRWCWGIFLKNSPQELIGAVDLWSPGHPEHRGFWLGRNFWNQGIMTEATDAVTDYAFNELNFDKLVFANAVGNLKSRRVKEKAGARLLKIESAAFVDPKFTEHELWELRKEDWKRK